MVGIAAASGKSTDDDAYPAPSARFKRDDGRQSGAEISKAGFYG
jgi:hypothetical protein